MSWTFRRIAAAFLITLAAVAVAPAPARAAPPVHLAVRIGGYSFLPGENRYIGRAIVYADRPVTIDGASLELQVGAGLTGVGLSETGHIGYCNSIGRPPGTMSCAVITEPTVVGPEGTPVGVDGWVTVDDTAVTGAAGTLTATLEAPGYADAVGTSTIRIGTPVDLVGSMAGQNLGARPGGTFAIAPEVTNDTDVPVKGAALLSYAQYAINTTTNFRNCWYGGGQLQACSFDQDLAPHTTYRARLGYRLRPDAYAPSDNTLAINWETGDELADDLANHEFGGAAPSGTRGTGGVLRLEAVASALAATPPQLDRDEENNWINLSVKATGVNGADVAAVGARAAGAAGSVVTIAVGIRNNGPATIDWNILPDAELGHFKVVVPPHATAVEVPGECYPEDAAGQPAWEHPHEPGWAAYLCPLRYFFPAGQAYTRDFRLRIDSVVAGASGSVIFVGFPQDLRKDNNTAAIVLNAPGGSGGSGGSGGGLPITGPGTGAIAGAAALLIAGGVLLLLRRRRLRFEA